MGPINYGAATRISRKVLQPYCKVQKYVHRERDLKNPHKIPLVSTPQNLNGPKLNHIFSSPKQQQIFP